MPKLTTNILIYYINTDFTTGIQSYSSNVINSIYIGNCRKDFIYIELLRDGVSYHNSKLLL
jgi:hypothetical protein